MSLCQGRSISYDFGSPQTVEAPMQRLVDHVLAVTKESIKTFTYESLNHIARLINGLSALLLAFLPGKTTILEGIHGWELRPTFRGPRLPRWMENGVSSFNQFIYQLSMVSDTSSSVDCSSEEEDSDGDVHLVSPLSQSSRASRARGFTKYDEGWTSWIKFVFSWILFPVTFFLGIPFFVCNLFLFRGSEAPSATGSQQQLRSAKKTRSLKDFVVHRATDRRRGVIEDLHLAIEIFIEAVFDVVHKAAHYLLSPMDAIKILFSWFPTRSIGARDSPSFGSNASVPTATLGDSNPTPTERKTFHQVLNTDARTCQDVITELGYPYEAIRVVTDDGYVLLLERLPRRDARKAVYLQHGILDSSMGWVSNGVVGSPAFAAFDQGFDVFLGNFRGLVSREHVDQNISSRQYWRYTVNEHGTKDIPAMIEKIHEVKKSELMNCSPGTEEESNGDQPYKLCTICHSLGGAAILMYVLTCRIQEKPHRLSRLVLLSPAGFHSDSNFVFNVMEFVVLSLAPILAPIIPSFYIPTRFFRMLLNKLARDFYNYPALGGLVQTLVSYFVGGDSSNWIGVMGLPHYNMDNMPALSFGVVEHLAQMKRANKFIMYDYGSESANMEAYDTPEPLDLGEYYGLFDIPIDLVAGQKDQVIRPAMIKKHYKLMKAKGVQVSYNEFEYAHLDFTFSHLEELLTYLMSRILLVDTPSPMLQSGLKTARLNKKD